MRRRLFKLKALKYCALTRMSVCVFLMAAAGTQADDTFEVERDSMVQDQMKTRGIKNIQVLEAIRKVPRHEFVPSQWRNSAYDDGPLPIGFGQTISQPYIVALMTELANIKPGDKILEIGTGSGYQAAVFAQITDSVFTIEIIEPLAKSAEERFKRLGYGKIQVKFADGYFGWPEHAPYDAIVVTAAADHVPPPLIEQLKPGGRIIIPLGSPFQQQWLVLVEKDRDGKIKTRNIAPVVFVPFTRSQDILDTDS